MKTKTPIQIARQIAAPGTNHRVVAVPGAAAPRLVGKGFFSTSACRAKTRPCRVVHTVVDSPNAYKWKMDYHPSTLRVEVGQEWLDAQSGATPAP